MSLGKVTDVHKESNPRNPVLHIPIHRVSPSPSDFLSVTLVKSGTKHSEAWNEKGGREEGRKKE